MCLIQSGYTRKCFWYKGNKNQTFVVPLIQCERSMFSCPFASKHWLFLWDTLYSHLCCETKRYWILGLFFACRIFLDYAVKTISGEKRDCSVFLWLWSFLLWSWWCPNRWHIQTTTVMCIMLIMLWYLSYIIMVRYLKISIILT